MISCENLFRIFKKEGLTFFTGVPDSTFKEWTMFLADEHGKRLTNIIACNECEAVAIASGYHLATGKVGVVYMQNSGEGKTVNPLTSLCDPEVYSIPVFLIIGWRGEPGKKDEPQHKKMGRIMIPLLDTLEIPYKILPPDMDEAEKVIAEMKLLSERNMRPVAVIVTGGLLDKYEPKSNVTTNYEMTREDAIKVVVDNLNSSDIIISTTGKTSRELFEYRISRKEKPNDFYTVGSMGCSISIANGVALHKPTKKVFVLDGDGAVLMQMGSLATTGYYKAKNLYHIILDNGAHDSTGGQPTVSPVVRFDKVALACGYKSAREVKNKSELIKYMKTLESLECPQMLVIKINKGSRHDLGRPTATPIENKKEFMKHLNN